MPGPLTQSWFVRHVAVAAALLNLPGASPSGNAQQLLFKERIDLVRHHVAVIDNRTGRPVTGLTREDFTVSENGTPREIAAFITGSEIRVAAQGTFEAESNDRRVFLLIFGGGRLEGPVNPYEGAIDFLRKRLRPEDLVSVMAFNRALPFTTDHELAARTVERLEEQAGVLKLHLIDDAPGTRAANEDLSADVQAAIDDVFRVAGARDTLLNAATLLLGSPVPRQNTVSWRPWNRRILAWDLLKVYAGIESLRRLEGRKHLICFTPWGFSPPITFVNEDAGMRLRSAQDDRRLARHANDAEATLHTIVTDGNWRGSFMAIAGAQNAARYTGGQFTSLRTAGDALARIDEATRAEYVLGYVPANRVMDGTYRNISVTVNRPNVTVLHRTGYTARANTAPLDPREIMTRERLRVAAALGMTLKDIGIQASASRARMADGTSYVRVQIVIDGSRLTLTRMGTKYEGVIDLRVLCADDAGNVVGEIDQQMTLGLDEPRHRQAVTTGIPYTAVVPVSGTATRVKVLVYEYEADRLGTSDIRIR